MTDEVFSLRKPAAVGVALIILLIYDASVGIFNPTKSEGSARVVHFNEYEVEKSRDSVSKVEPNEKKYSTQDVSTSTNPPTKDSGCAQWGCTCQGLANFYGSIAGREGRNDDVARKWWSLNNCKKKNVRDDLEARKALFKATAFLEHIYGAKKLPKATSESIDVVSLTIKEDFDVLFEAEGLLSWLKLIRNIRSVTFISRGIDLKPIVKNIAAIRDRLPKTIPIRFFNEDYFKRVYHDMYGAPYSKVFQQLLKMSAFDIPDIGDNVAIIDSDTVWANPHTLLYSNGSGAYCNRKFTRADTQEEFDNLLQCRGMDPVNVIEGLFHGTGCDFSPYCGTNQSSGFRHICHHILFQRDVMQDLARTAARINGGNSLWETVMRSWKKSSASRGRFSEYEIYYTFAACKHPQRVTNVRPQFIVSSSNCSRAEMELCESKGILLKMCNNGHKKMTWTRGLCRDVIPSKYRIVW